VNTPFEPTDIRNPISPRAFGRVRWLPIFAGLIAALVILVVLSIVGTMIGATTYNPDGAAATVGLGAGAWGVLSALIAFAVGGWLAARISAVTHPSNGILSGALVWIGALALILFVLVSGMGAINPTSNTTKEIDTSPISGVPADIAAINEAAPPTTAPGVAQTTLPAEPLDHTLWSTLAWAALGFLAASFGGWVGSRSRQATTNWATVGFETHSAPGHD
jgi:hypothetical protein